MKKTTDSGLMAKVICDTDLAVVDDRGSRPTSPAAPRAKRRVTRLPRHSLQLGSGWREQAVQVVRSRSATVNDYHSPAFNRVFFSLTLYTFFVQLLFVPFTRAGEDTVVPAQVQVAFGTHCEEMLIGQINQAKTDVLVAIHNITRRGITSAIVRAAQRGVKVRVKYDAKSYEEKGMQQAIGYMKKRGIKCTPVKMTNEYARMHHKFMVIDRERVFTGSYNYTTTASTKNYENLVLIHSARIAESFAEEFEKIKSE